MRRMKKRLFTIGMLASLLLMTACGTEDTESTQSAQIDEEKVVIATAPPSETEAAATSGETSSALQGDARTPSGAAVEAKIQKYAVVQGCNIRQDCSGDSEWVGTLYAGQVVQGTGVCENGWIQIYYNEASYYVTGSCLEETEEGTALTGSETKEEASTTESPQQEDVDVTEFFDTTEALQEVDVTDWAKYTSSKWEASDRTSCFLQIHSVAGNQVIFRLQVVDGPLSDLENEDSLIAEIPNCTGKIEDGILGFSFTDNYGNIGVGKMEIVDDTHLSIATVITQAAEDAAYKAEIMTELTEVDD